MAPELQTLELLLTVLATAVMAASAATQAVRCGLDPVGAIFLSVVTAVGGGTLRDLLIGATPVFWLEDPTYLLTAVPVGLVTHALVGRMRIGTGRRLKLLDYLDAVGLALFTVVGARVALANGASPMAAIVLGCLTGIAGGMCRDVLCGITPIVLRRDVYATLSLIGAALYVLLVQVTGSHLSLWAAFAAIALSRVSVVAMRPTEKVEPEAEALYRPRADP